MKADVYRILAAVFFLVAGSLIAPPAVAQEHDHSMHDMGAPAPPAAVEIQGELGIVIAEAEEKFNSLAAAFTPQQYRWRPREGVRSVSEVLMHVAGNNYWMPIELGANPPAGVPIRAEYLSVDEYEAISDKGEVLAAVEASFKHLDMVVANLPPERLDEVIDIFGKQGTVRAYLFLTTHHMHEHLGQLIAYARMLGVTPPWSM